MPASGVPIGIAVVIVIAQRDLPHFFDVEFGAVTNINEVTVVIVM